MKSLSKMASAIQGSSTLAIDAMAKQLRADGLDVIGFGTGEPDFDTPDSIKQAGIDAILQGKTKYTPAAGIVDLRKAAAYRLEQDCGVKYDYTQIVVASGAKHCLFAAMCALLDQGDEVIVQAPYWVSYLEMVRMAGGCPVVIESDESTGFKISPEQLEAAITDKTKIFVINNPSNPTGMVYSASELKDLADVCVKHDLYIISDEVYYKLVYDGRKFTSLASLSEDIKDRTILINGVSKTYAMTGWRIGYAAADVKIAKVMSNFLSHSTGAPGTMNQYAAAAALTGPQDCVEDMRKVFEQRRNYIVERVNSIPGVSCIMPEGAFYIMMNIEKLIGRTIGGKVINNDDDFAAAFLEQGLVAVVPCSGFGIKNFVRWTYAASIENIKEAMDRLEEFLA